MAWDIEIVFAAPPKKSHRKAKQIAKAMLKSIPLYVKDVEWSDLSDRLDPNPGQFSLIKVSVKLAYNLVPAGEYKPLQEAIFRRLVVFGVAKGFTPLDNDGDVMYALEPYGFLMFYVNAVKGKGEELERIVNQVSSEVDTPTYGIVKHLPEASNVYDFYKVSMNFTDYRNQEARHRLMLAVYFRITMLAKQHGFLAFQVPDEDESERG